MKRLPIFDQHLRRMYAELPLLGKKTYCPICNKKYNFLNMGKPYTIFTCKKIIGGGLRKKVRCPICDINDRIRWCYYVLIKYTTIFNEKSVILHIAPEKGLEKIFRRNEKITYISGDLQEGKADIVCDITKLQFENNYFDYILINHVLEHIKEENLAFKEMKRVLKDTGYIICSFPICLSEDTYENECIINKKDRIKYYGQKDHVRLYGRDVKSHLEAYGLEVREFITDMILTDDEILKMNVIKGDRIFICNKK